MDFKKSVQEVSGPMPRLVELRDWPEKFPRTKVDAAPPIDYGPMESSNQDMDTRYIRRVHEITEHLVPIKYWENHFGNSRLPLIQAVGQGDLHWVRQILLETDTDPNTRSFQGWTALQQACDIGADCSGGKNQEAIVRLLISQGADVTAARGEGYGRTALQAACECGNERIVDLLLEKGAGVNEDVGVFGGQSSLAGAVWARHIGIVKKLLDRGADINQPRSEELGHTALSAAAQSGNLEMLDFLIENGADTQGSAGSFALEKAIGWDRLDVAQRLLELGLDVNYCADGPAPLHSVESMDMLNLLVSYGARFDLPGSNASGPTALQRAVRWHTLDLVTELVRLGSDVHHPGPAKRGRSALQAAASRWYGDLRIMSFLVEEHGANVNEPRSEEEGYTSLEAACHTQVTQQRVVKRDITNVKFLVERGAIITPFTLHVAAAWNHTELLGFLLQNGARTEDISSSTNIPIVVGRSGDYREFGSTVIETARINDHIALAEALENWSPSTQLEMHAGEEDSDQEDSDREDSD
jgi:ankyrin repeat protein